MKELTNTNPGQPSRDEIAKRAYAIYEASGRQEGHALEHWLQAERQLTTGRKANVRASAGPETRSATHEMPKQSNERRQYA